MAYWLQDENPTAACVDCGSSDCEGWDGELSYGLHLIGGNDPDKPTRVGYPKLRYQCNDCGLRWVA